MHTSLEPERPSLSGMGALSRAPRNDRTRCATLHSSRQLGRSVTAQLAQTREPPHAHVPL